MIRFALIVAFFSSVLFASSFLAIVFGVLLIAFTRGWALALTGGVFLDVLYGTPVYTLFGISYVYTLVFIVLIGVALLLRIRLLE